MVKTLTVYEEINTWYTDRQSVVDDGKTIFSVCNLCECPEDAIIGRDLFDAHDFVRAVEYGMKLAKDGYTSIEVVISNEEE